MPWVWPRVKVHGESLGHVHTPCKLPDMSYDDVFRREAVIGHGWSERVAAALNSVGVKCHTEPLEFAKDVADRARFGNEQDVILDLLPGCIEVKSRAGLRFTADPASYPYDTAFVDTVHGWHKKNPTPHAVVLVSRPTGHFLVVGAGSQKHWTKEVRFDRQRQITDTFYMAHKQYLRTFDLLVDFLLRWQNDLQS